MASKKKTPKQDDAFSELDDSPVAPVVTTKPLSISLPEGTTPEMVEKIKASLEQKVKDEIASEDGVSAGRKAYLKESQKRFRCRVNSLRPGWDHFELTIPDANDNPKAIRGRCGVIIEDGLTLFTIRQLQYTHDYRTEEGRSMTVDQIMSARSTLVLDYKSVKQPHYSVEILGEVENPKGLNDKIGGGE